MAFVAGIEAAGLNTLFKGGTIDIAASCPCEDGPRTMIYPENIDQPPPLARLTDAGQRQLEIDAIASEDLWVQDFIDRLAGVVRDLKQH
jgi:hypothetical protein